MNLGPMFLDWTRLGVDDAGEPIHRPTIEGGMVVCRCHQETCELDRALFRSRVVGFLQAWEARPDRDPRGALEDQ